MSAAEKLGGRYSRRPSSQAWSGVDKQGIVEDVPLLGMTTVLLVNERLRFLRPVLGHVGVQSASDGTEHASANFLIE